MNGIEVSHAVTTVVAMIIGRIKHGITQMSCEKTVAKVAVKGFNHKIIPPCFGQKYLPDVFLIHFNTLLFS